MNGLSRAFVESHTAEAARVLEALPPGDTAGFLAELAPQLAASLLRHMSPPYSAKLFEALGDERAAGLYRVAGPQAAAQVLQQFSHERQAQLLALLPVGMAVAIRLLIGYPAGTCGGCMNPWPLTLMRDTSAAEALAQVRAFEGEIGDCVFVTDDQRRLQGVTALDALVRAAPATPLEALMVPPEHTVSALAMTAAVAGNPGWDFFHVLPVVERENRLVGALHRHALAASAAPRAPQAAGGAEGVAGAYWQTISVLAQVVVGALPAVPPLEPPRRKDER
jgi:magnesium transporter